MVASPRVFDRALDRGVSDPGIVAWQNRRTRRIGPQINPVGMLMIACAVLGAAACAGQVAGRLHWTGPLALAPVALLLAALNAPLIAGAKAALRWLGG